MFLQNFQVSKYKFVIRRKKNIEENVIFKRCWASYCVNEECVSTKVFESNLFLKYQFQSHFN